METTEFFEKVLRETSIFKDMDGPQIATLAGCAKNVAFRAEDRIFRQGEQADSFLVLREGHVAIDMDSVDQGAITVQTLDAGDVLGWSWLFPPYEWNYGARAVLDTRAVALDAKCLRGKCDSDPALGYELMKRFSSIMLERLQSTRIQLMDIYGPDKPAAE